MGLEVAEIAELAALRPIQTTAVSGAQAAAAGADDHHGAAAADTGCCVTPTASRERATAWAAGDDGAAADGIGCATPTASEPMEAPRRDGDTIYATPRTTALLGGLEEGAAASDAGLHHADVRRQRAEAGDGVPAGAAEAAARAEEEAGSAAAAALLPGAARPGHRLQARAGGAAACCQEDAGACRGVISATGDVKGGTLSRSCSSPLPALAHGMSKPQRIDVVGSFCRKIGYGHGCRKNLRMRATNSSGRRVKPTSDDMAWLWMNITYVENVSMYFNIFETYYPIYTLYVALVVAAYSHGRRAPDKDSRSRKQQLI